MKKEVSSDKEKPMNKKSHLFVTKKVLENMSQKKQRMGVIWKHSAGYFVPHLLEGTYMGKLF